VPEPALALAAIMAMLLTVYVLLGGADFGGGVWDLVAHGERGERQRATIARAIAPVWEANHVWLIVVITILFNAFPTAFARLSVQLHVPLALMLVGIVLRGSAFVFRAYGPSAAGYVRAWSLVFAGASTATPVAAGAVVGAITEGRMDPRAVGFSAVYLAPWLTPFALSVGIFALVLFAYLAAVYLTLEADDPVTASAFRLRAIGSGVLVAVMAVVVFVLADEAPHVREALSRSRWAVPLHVATGGSAVAALFLLWTHRFWFARLAAAAQVTFIVWGWALAQFPYLIRPDVTIESSAAPKHVLVLLLRVLGLGAIILLPALLYLFHIFRPAARANR